MLTLWIYNWYMRRITTNRRLHSRSSISLTVLFSVQPHCPQVTSHHKSKKTHKNSKLPTLHCTAAWENRGHSGPLAVSLWMATTGSSASGDGCMANVPAIYSLVAGCKPLSHPKNIMQSFNQPSYIVGNIKNAYTNAANLHSGSDSPAQAYTPYVWGVYACKHRPIINPRAYMRRS